VKFSTITLQEHQFKLPECHLLVAFEPDFRLELSMPQDIGCLGQLDHSIFRIQAMERRMECRYYWDGDVKRG